MAAPTVSVWPKRTLETTETISLSFVDGTYGRWDVCLPLDTAELACRGILKMSAYRGRPEVPDPDGSGDDRRNHAVSDQAATSKSYASMKSNASCQRTTPAVDGDGKCAVHISVDVSQKRPKNCRL